MRIKDLKKEKNAIILAHNYVRPEIQDIADFVGDSLELALKASKVDADLILFCGVDFMAETIAILNPSKKVLVPDIATCSLAQMLDTDSLLDYKKLYPDAKVVLYINTLAKHKIYADAICTSSNAPEIVDSMDSDKVLFGPDINLARYVANKTSKEIIPVPRYGFCSTHYQITINDLSTAVKKHPNAEIVVHPECTEDIQKKADVIASTSGIIRYCKRSNKEEFLIGTEIGLIHRLKREMPDKEFYMISKFSVCPSMKIHTLDKIERALKTEIINVTIDKNIASKAVIPIKRMIEITSN
ncbi:MAG: quinolinate synthase NadA [Candidatus Methanoliparum thermophilum]|uniref:Quinolinate synthase n=1 Tax=Methanoliparum thermophilum TaxID=2491083 RepID=A0A520KSU1_METT2|nr:MAG: quinolinate synthase NadA [Candidatus Methanoliparum thermophilum]BDC36135.1 quinolinate synthase [Candidatus Methanoliparum sp. LAM-1]